MQNICFQYACINCLLAVVYELVMSLCFSSLPPTQMVMSSEKLRGDVFGDRDEVEDAGTKKTLSKLDMIATKLRLNQKKKQESSHQSNDSSATNTLTLLKKVLAILIIELKHMYYYIIQSVWSKLSQGVAPYFRSHSLPHDMQRWRGGEKPRLYLLIHTPTTAVLASMFIVIYRK